MTTSTLDHETTETTEHTLPDLTGHDRCDNGGCNAASYVRARLPKTGLDLTFCGHHFAKHETGLAAAGAEIRDERARLSASYLDVEATELAKE